jgi:hypothetical protein
LRGEDSAARFLYFTKIELAVRGGGDPVPLDSSPKVHPHLTTALLRKTIVVLPPSGGGRRKPIDLKALAKGRRIGSVYYNRHGAAKPVLAITPTGVILGLVPRTQRAAEFVVKSERAAATTSRCRLRPRSTLGPRDKPEDDIGGEESAVVTGGCIERGP